MKRSIAGVGLVIAAAVVAGCGSGGNDSGPPEGQSRPLGFGTGDRVELFVPDGWDMTNADNLSSESGVADGVTYAILDRASIPKELSDAVAGDDEARARFAGLAQSGAAVTAQFTQLAPCDSVRSLISDEMNGIEFDSLDDVGDGIGESQKLGVSTREVEGTAYRFVQYYSTVPLSSSHCVGLRLQSKLSGDDSGAVDASRDVIKEIAENSTIESTAGAPDSGGTGGENSNSGKSGDGD